MLYPGQICRAKLAKMQSWFLGFCSSSTLGNFVLAFCDGGICAGLL